MMLDFPMFLPGPLRLGSGPQHAAGPTGSEVLEALQGPGGEPAGSRITTLMMSITKEEETAAELELKARLSILASSRVIREVGPLDGQRARHGWPQPQVEVSPPRQRGPDYGTASLEALGSLGAAVVPLARLWA